MTLDNPEKMKIFLLLVSTLGGSSVAGRHHEDTDYCDLLGQDDIQSVKHGFLAGNNVMTLTRSGTMTVESLFRFTISEEDSPGTRTTRLSASHIPSSTTSGPGGRG